MGADDIFGAQTRAVVDVHDFNRRTHFPFEAHKNADDVRLRCNDATKAVFCWLRVAREQSQCDVISQSEEVLCVTEVKGGDEIERRTGGGASVSF